MDFHLCNKKCELVVHVMCGKILVRIGFLLGGENEKILMKNWEAFDLKLN